MDILDKLLKALLGPISLILEPPALTRVVYKRGIALNFHVLTQLILFRTALS